MDGRFENPFTGGRDEAASSPENAVGSSSPTATIADRQASSSAKRSRRAVQKRVVSVPIAEVEGSRLKGEGAPPSDSWAWRKYGQKPIKGSPYPRGYYRCSSSKGCPARKQVERSRADPTMLVVTYACEHNHPWPASRTAAAASPTQAPQSKPADPSPAALVADPHPPDADTEETFADLPEAALLPDDFTWFTGFSTPSPVLQSQLCSAVSPAAIVFPMEEEDESLFADLGELPECALVFRRGLIDGQESLRAAPFVSRNIEMGGAA